MCEQTSVKYNHGDVVWVKLGPCWWPGEVVSFEELPSDISESFKKPPLAVVKFFDEEKYEFVKQLTHIHTYNSNKKYDFIRKGLDLHRAKNAFMDKFPKDVCAAETKTGGDPNILNDPKVGPEKRPNYSSIFGSPVARKKSSKDSPGRGRGRGSTGKHSSPNSTKPKNRFITHPRFLGKDDSEIRILVQRPPTATELPETEYECYICGFKSSRIEVIVLHKKYHLASGSSPSHTSPKKTKKSPVKRPKKRSRMPTSKTSSIEEDLALLRQGLPVCSDHTTSEESSDDSDEEPLVKRKSKPKSPPKPKKIKSAPPPEVKKQTDIRTDLLAEWDDDEDEEEPAPIVERISPKLTLNSVESKDDVEVSKADDKDKEKSCFDFVEDEEDLLTALEGRKIPRVIPPTDKRKSTQDRENEEKEEANEEITVTKSRSPSPKNKEDNVIESETEKSKEDSDIQIQSKIDDDDTLTKKRESQFQLEFEAFNNALRETAGPDILDIPPLTKFEQNFHKDKTIKFPDKLDESDNSKVTPPDNENVKIEADKELENNKSEPIAEPVPEPTKEPAVRNPEVATKLTNPKKRFVKTFEDETKNSTKEESVASEKKKEPRLEPFSSELKSLEVSKLKTQLMRKLIEASPKKESNKYSEKSKKTSHKGRRFMINAEKTKTEVVENKESKRTIVESVSDNESVTHVKKKRYCIEEDDDDNEIKFAKSEVTKVVRAVSPKEFLEDKKVSERAIKSANQLDYLNSSPSKIFRELHVDNDELLDVGSLSESQKLTIQDIIGVSSPNLAVHQSVSNKSNFKEEKMQVDEIVEENITTSEDRLEETFKKDVENSELATTKVEEKRVEEDEEMNKLAHDVSEEPSTEIESKVDQITTSSPLFQIDEKLSGRISEKLPDEIIELPKKETVEEAEETIVEKVDDDLEKTVTEFTEKPMDEKEEGNKVEEEINKLEEEVNKAEKEINKTKEEINKAEEEINKAVEEVNKVEEEVNKVEEEVNKVEEEVNKAEEEVNKAEEEVNKAEEEVNKAEEEVNKAEEVNKTEEVNEAEEINKVGEVNKVGEKQNESTKEELFQQPACEEKIEIPELEQPEKVMEEHVNIENNEQIQKESEQILKGDADDFPEKETEVNLNIDEKREKSAEEIVEEQTNNKLEEADEKSLEEKKEENLGEIKDENLDKLVSEDPKVTQIAVEEAKDDTKTSINKLIIDRQSESPAHAVKEDSPINDENKKELHLPLESMGKNKSELVKSMFKEEEMVNIEGNLTVVTEIDLADKQVEIATTPEVSKPITLTSFSMDFCEDVETYVKGETIMQNFSKAKIDSPVNEQASSKSKVKDDQVDATKEENTMEIEIETVQNVEDMELCQDETKESLQKKKLDSPKLTLNIQNDEKIESKTTELKQFENVITPAKEKPPAVIMEGFEEIVKENKPEVELSIDETSSKIQGDEKDAQESNSTGETIEEHPTKEILIEANTIDKGSSTCDIVKEVSQKEEIIIPPMDISVESEVAKITDSIIEQEVVIQDSSSHHNTSTTSTKLLEILTDKPKSSHTKASPTTSVVSKVDDSPIIRSKTLHKHLKSVTKQSPAGPSRTNKATILSDKLIKPLDESKTVSVKKVTSKRSFQDVEDIDTYIIQKPVKKLNLSVESDTAPKIIKKPTVISKGKARILQQTIITPTGDILQPPVSQSQTDDNMFDINSMPIVLSDQILTPESIENMQIVLQENTPTTKSQITPIKKQTQVTQPQQMKLLNKTQSPAGIGLKETILKNPIQKQIQINKQKMQKVYPSTPKIIKHNPSVITQPGKQGKFIIVPATTTATGTKYTVGKRPAIVKKPPPKVVTPISKAPEIPMTSSGSKIMILKSQGQQQKILLSTSHKQFPQAKVKGRAIQKQIIAKESLQSKGANIISQTILNSKGQITTLASQNVTSTRGQIIATMAQQNRNIKIDTSKMKRAHQRISLQNEIAKPSTSGQQRTIIIKNPQGQTVKKIQGTDDALLDQQVAEQLQAISRASQLKDLQPRASAKLQVKKPFMKKHEVKVTKSIIHNTQTPNKNVSVPPLAPISPAKKIDTHYTEPGELSIAEEKSDEPKRQPHQLVIQDAQGNQTTITEGQILALPSEAIEGQPHSYVLVTLDETGNLTPLNSEALMSLDPNLNLTSDLGNMVLQIDQGATPEAESPVPESPQRTVTEQLEVPNTPSLLLKESVDKTPTENVLLTETPSPEASDQNVQAVINSGEMGQLIITGDAVTAQKFLESLAEGNADLANLLANAEGNVLIQADGQQILINTDSENPMLVMNPENISNENSEGSGNPIFASQPVKNQDILAAALADTDVFQQDQSISHSPSKVAQSQLSPNSSLYPMNVGNVLETNSMSSPIMTPLEVPSTNSKKIDDENEILTQVPKNVDLPITITDPNISQTVAQQQVASLIATELSTNLDLPLAIQDPGLSVTSTEMSSPSFVYSLPTLDDTVDINQKAFSGSISMPLLTEEPEDPIAESSNGAKEISEPKESKTENESDKKDTDVEDVKTSEETDTNKSDSKEEIDTDEKKTDFINSGGLCAMRGGICNSLSEPPPDMFDFSIENQTFETPHITQNTDMDIPVDSTPSSELSNTINDRESSVSSVEERKTDEVALYTANTSPSTNTDDSCEIPVQPPIIAKPFEENGTTDSRFGEEDKITTDGDV